MGTNYYHQSDCCKHCKRSDKRHIGKSSKGWQFSFQGYKADKFPEDGDIKVSNLEIKSYKDWLAVLWKSLKIDKTGKIINEYGNEISFDDFVLMVKNHQGEPNNQYDHCSERQAEHVFDMSRDWKDEEGYAFTLAEFS